MSGGGPATPVTQSFLVKGGDDISDTHVVFAIDASASTQSAAPHGSGATTVYDWQIHVMKQIASQYGVKSTTRIDLMFWNSDHQYGGRNPNSPMATGTRVNGNLRFKDACVVAKSFEKNRSDFHGTHTWLVYERLLKIIKEKQLEGKKVSLVLITDGQMLKPYGYETRLRDSLTELSKNKNFTHAIHAVVPQQNISVESMSRAAGGDLYNAICSLGLSSILWKFTLHMPRGDIPLINKQGNIAAGMVPVHGCYQVKDTEMHLYIEWLEKEVIPNLTGDDDDVSDLISHLSSTLAFMCKNDLPAMKNAKVQAFINLFSKAPTAIRDDVMESAKALIGIVDDDLSGRAATNLDIRRRTLAGFKDAIRFLNTNAYDAFGRSSEMVSVPVKEGDTWHSYRFPGDIATASFVVPGVNYNKACVNVGGKLLPMMPVGLMRTSAVDQCVRIGLRSYFGHLMKVSSQDIALPYILGGFMLLFTQSDGVSDELKSTWRTTFEVALSMKKAKMGAMTELQFMRDGNAPRGNTAADGTTRAIFERICWVGDFLGLTLRPGTLWAAICAASGDKALFINQLKHCEKDLELDEFDRDGDAILAKISTMLPKLVVHSPPARQYDYSQCPITLEPIPAGEGGFVLDYIDQNGNHVFMNNVISTTAALTLMASGRCCITRQLIGEDSYKEVGPCPEVTHTLDGVTSDTRGVLKSGYNASYPTAMWSVPTMNRTSLPVAVAPARSVAARVVQPKARYAGGGGGSRSSASVRNLSCTYGVAHNVAIGLRGVVGAGKTTMSNMLKTALEAEGYKVVIVSADEFSSTNGMNFSDTSRRCTQKIVDAATGAFRTVLIFDLCNEKGFDVKNVFGCNLTGWGKVPAYPNAKNGFQGMDRDTKHNYVNWCARNVLRRPRITDRTQYHGYMLNANESTFGLTGVKGVILGKARPLLGKKNVPVMYSGGSVRNKTPSSPAEVQAFVDQISTSADQYKTWLDANVGTLDAQVAHIVAKVKTH